MPVPYEGKENNGGCISLLEEETEQYKSNDKVWINQVGYISWMCTKTKGHIRQKFS